MNDLTHLDLFSGIGGFALAARTCGLRTIAFSETDPYCIKVLEKNFPGVPQLGDIRNVRHAGPAWLVTGGFPCQPFSVAGKRRGASDDRALWPRVAHGIPNRVHRLRSLGNAIVPQVAAQINMSRQSIIRHAVRHCIKYNDALLLLRADEPPDETQTHLPQINGRQKTLRHP